MPRTILALILAGALLGCTKTGAPPAATASQSAQTPATPPKDAFRQKLEEISGNGATDCGRHEIQAQAPELTAASNCAQQAVKGKKPFYVAYDMPGMSVGVAGTAEGKLFSVSLQGSGTGAQLENGPCPAALRVAASGRVTCFTPGSMSLGGNDPHAGMNMNPGTMNPHGSGGFPTPAAPLPSKRQ
jgi:hypothetical protein